MSRTALPSVILSLAASALLTGSFVGHAQADTVWRSPYKGMPYAAPHEHSERVAVAQNRWKPKAVQTRNAKRTHVAGSPSAIR